ncbi:EF-hand calcium-binding domain-containing protein 1-like isoform X1 [Cimex lectularius]|uniref:EF-hand domain-containing protein n=1 Tax=Cimex lectularius TaxID=79782 RepID=A0A8I6R8L6_CIMLE|nr:EF-hand calcium-binding domain-containing protein 1-like isoform X1 [Cimex lectularius]
MTKPGKLNRSLTTKKNAAPSQRPAMRVIHLDLTMTQSEDARAKHKMRAAFEDLRGKTAFNDWELSCILLIYYKMTQGAPIARPEFRNFIHNVFGISRQDIVERIFSALDEPNSPGLEPQAFVILLSIFTRGSLDDKIDFVFQVYDSMCLGYIGREAMTKLLVPTLLTRRQEHEAVENAIDMVDLLMRKIDKDRDGRIAYSEFIEQMKQNEKLLEVFSQVIPDRMDKYAFMATFTPRVATTQSKYMMKNTEIPALHNISLF